MSQVRMIYGMHAVMAALSHRPENIVQLYCVDKENPRFKDFLLKAEACKIPVQYLSRIKLDNLVQSAHHQGVGAKIRPAAVYHEQSLYDWLATTTTKPLILILEGIQDPHNLGACLRSAEAFGVDWVVLSKMHTAPVNATVSKVACGADQMVAIAEASNIARCIELIKHKGVWVVGTAIEGAVPLTQAAMGRSLALVMGAEGKGLKRLTLEACDEIAKIPLRGTISSVNVSVATGIGLYECSRQRAQQSSSNPSNIP